MNMDGETSHDGDYQTPEVPPVEWDEAGYQAWLADNPDYQSGTERKSKPPFKIPRPVAAGLVVLAMAAAAKFGIDKAREILDPISGAVGAPGLVPPSVSMKEGGVVPTEENQAKILATVISATRTPTPAPEAQRIPPDASKTSEKTASAELPSLPSAVVMRYLAALQSDSNLMKAAEPYLKEPGREDLVIAGPRKNWKNPVPIGNYYGGEAKEYKPGWGGDTVVTLEGVIPFRVYKVPLPDGKMTTDSYVAIGPDGRVIFNVVGKDPVNKSGYQVFQNTPGVAIYSGVEGGESGIVYGGGMSVKKSGEGVDDRGRKSLALEFGVYGVQQLTSGSELSGESSPTPQGPYPDAGIGR